MREQGERVIAISHGDESKMYIFGEGEYIGEQVPDEKATAGMAPFMRENDIPNPAILLDDGQVVYGCECWWGSVDGFRAKYPDTPVEVVDLQAHRAENTHKEED